MKIKLFYLALVLVLVALPLAGCTLSASTPPVETLPAGGVAQVTPGVAGTDTMGVFGAILTQTASAINAGQPNAVVTPAAPEATTVPESQPVQPPSEGETTTAPQPQPEVVTPAENQPAPGDVEIPALVVPSTYTLEKGEFPYCIARRFNINPADLLNANGLGVNTTTYPGLRLTIPQNARPFPGNTELRSHPATYTVRSNDTIYGIACTYGDVDPAAIAAVNGLQAPYTLSVGQTLQIP